MVGKVVRFPGLVTCFGVILSAVVLFAFPYRAVQGAVKGLEVCASVVVPSLFPFLVLSAFAAASPSCAGALNFLSPLMRYVFRLPCEAAPAVLFGLVGGYPVGCASAYQLYTQGKISAEQAQRLTCFCVNAGPAFVITAVGSVMLGNIKAGVILFASCVIASVIIGVTLGLTAPVPEKKVHKKEALLTETQALVEATERAAQSIIKICAWTVLFNCVVSTLETLGISEKALCAIRCLLEVTGGCASAAKCSNLCVIAAAVGWGGLCVCCQVLENVKKCGAPLSVFFAFRAVHSALAAVICGVLLRLFPIEISVYSDFAAVTVNSFSYSMPATAALVCLCAVFVIDLDRNGKVC